jgi:hypothetical protein
LFFRRGSLLPVDVGEEVVAVGAEVVAVGEEVVAVGETVVGDEMVVAVVACELLSSIALYLRIIADGDEAVGDETVVDDETVVVREIEHCEPNGPAIAL